MVLFPEKNAWLLQTNGVRQFKNGTEVYTKVRKVGDGPTADRGEMSKSYWDAQS